MLRDDVVNKVLDEAQDFGIAYSMDEGCAQEFLNPSFSLRIFRTSAVITLADLQIMMNSDSFNSAKSSCFCGTEGGNAAASGRESVPGIFPQFR
jgi:hypothetical protein